MSRVNPKNIPDTLSTYQNLKVSELSVLYLDLNSCFATVEQQSRPMLRNKPVAIANRLIEHSTIIAASIEAKQFGVKVGMRVEEAKQICPNIVFAESEPSKYFFVHEKVKAILKDYSPLVVMKSIDEGLVDLSLADVKTKAKTIFELGSEIKTRIFDEVGDYIKCNIGFGENRWFAKVAAELHKPNGMDVILAKPHGEFPANSESILAKLTLLDLPGINRRLEKRLNAFGIDNPYKFMKADKLALEKLVFRSIDGVKWYERLRGVEVDERVDTIKSVGRQFVLPPNTSEDKVRIYFMHLAEDVGFRLRLTNSYARGIIVWRTGAHGNYKESALFRDPFSSDKDIIERSLNLFDKLKKDGRIIGITLYKISNHDTPQISIFEKEKTKNKKVTNAVDEINRRFGKRTIHIAETTNTDEVKAKVPFGSTRYLK